MSAQNENIMSGGELRPGDVGAGLGLEPSEENGREMFGPLFISQLADWPVKVELNEYTPHDLPEGHPGAFLRRTISLRCGHCPTDSEVNIGHIMTLTDTSAGGYQYPFGQFRAEVARHMVVSHKLGMDGKLRES